MNQENKSQWYDGLIFEKVIMPIQQKVYNLYAAMIPSGGRVLDIATGTGGFAFTIAEKASYVAGIDLSEKNIIRAQRRKNLLGADNVDFFHGDARRTSEILGGRFDYAVLSMALHEMPPEIRQTVVEEACGLADKIIFVDYSSPLPKNIFGLFNYAVEYFAGREHYRSFRHFVANGGLEPLIKKNCLNIMDNKKINGGNMQLILAGK
jgi:SAM-dependent methyltransferase